MKTHNPTPTLRKLSFSALSMLTALAMLLGVVAPVLADPSPWTQTSASDFNDGTTSSTVVTSYGGGAVQLDTVGGNWRIDTEAQWDAWQSASNVTTPGAYLTLSRYYAWESSPSHSNNTLASTSNTSWTTLKTLYVDVTDVRNLRTTVQFRGDRYCILWWCYDTTGYIRVLVNGSQAFYDYQSGTSWEVDTFDTNVAGLSGTIPVQVQMYTSNSRGNAYNSTFEIRRERLVYYHSGTALHQYDAGHQVNWTSCSRSASTPAGTSAAFEYRTSDNGSTWSGWDTDCGSLANSRYLQQRVSLSGTDTATPQVDWTQVNYQSYQPSGTFTSSIRDPLANGGTQVDDWGEISWTESTPAGTDVRFQIATNTDSTTWNYVGPDCTSGSTYTTSGQAINDACHADDRYLRYRATFTVDAAHRASTPRLDDVTLTYNQEPQAPGLTGPQGSIDDDTPTFQWQAPSDPDGDSSSGFRYHIQVDDNNTFTSPEVDADEIGGLQYTSGPLADGTYWWRVRARDSAHDASFTDPYGAWSNVYQITIDTQSPNSWIDTGAAPPADPEHYGTDANPWPGQITGGAVDPAPSTGLQRVEVLVHDLTGGDYWNGSDWVTTAPANWPDAGGTIDWTFDLAEGHLTDGHTYEIFSQATDNVGNEQTVHGHTRFLYDTTVGFDGRIWRDTNGNGVLDGGETGISGVTVNLYDDAMTLVDADETDANGDYDFSGPALGLSSGTYTVEVDESDAELADLTLTSDPDTPLTAAYSAGEKATGLDFGYGPYALVEGYVWDDSNDRDGLRDAGEPGLADLTVWLRDGGGAIVNTEISGADGRYRFKGVAAGDYRVDVDQSDADMPDYYTATTPDPLAVSGVAVGQVSAGNDIGYALPETETKRLYLHAPDTLNRTAPSGGGSVSIPATWTQSPAMYTDFGMDTGQNIVVRLNGSGSANVELRVGSAGGALIGTGSGALGGSIAIAPLINTIPAGQGLWVGVTGSGTIDPAGSYIDLPAVTYVQVTAVGTYDAAYPGGSATTDFETHDTVYIRVTATDPFGDYDITAADVNIPGVGAFAMTQVDSGDDWRVFEYAYTDAAEGTYNPVVVTVEEGSEGSVSATGQTTFRCRSADVWVSKSADPTTVQSEDLVTFTLDYGNEGVLSAENATIVDTLPAGLTYAGMVSGPSPTVDGQTLTWDRGTLVAGFSGQLVFQATVDVTGAENATFTNQVEIGTDTGEADTSDNTDAVDVQLNQSADLTVTKTATDLNGAPLEPGDTLRYRITIRNWDYADATNGSLMDAIDGDTSFVPGSAAITPPGAGTLGALPNLVTALTVPGRGVDAYSEVIVEFDVTIDAPLPNGTAIENSATVDTDQAGPVEGTHSAAVVSDHQLAITKTPSENPAEAGSDLTYTIAYEVTGNEPAPNVVIRDTYPANATYVDCDGGLSCSESGGVVTWNLGTIDPLASGTVTLVVHVNSPQPDNTPLNNHVEISDDDGGFAEFNYNGFVGAGHTLTLEKSGAPNPVQAGGQIVYTLDYGVTGNENAIGVFITDTIPADTSFVSCTSGCTGPDGDDVITWNIGAVTAGSGGSVQFTVEVDDPLADGTTIHNTAWIADANDGAPTSADETTTVRSDHSYSLVKTAAPDPVEAGATLVYTIDWSVEGNEPVTGILIEDQVPAHTGFVGCSGGLSCDEDGGTITWQLGDAPTGDASGQVSFTVQVDSPLQDGLALQNQATIDDDDGDRETDSNIAATTVHSDHELWIAKTDAPDPVEAGATLAYTIDAGVTADSNGYATGVVITDCVPADTAFHSASGGAAPDANGCLQWNLGTLSPGATRQVTFTVQVDSPLLDGTTIANEAAIMDNEAKYETAATETLVHSDHELSIAKSGTPDPVEAVDGHIDYTINYSVPADGNEPALGVVITDALPDHTTFDSCWPAGGCTYDGGTGIVTWIIGDLVPGDSGTVGFRVNVPDPLPNGTAIDNTVFISDDDGETAQATATVSVSSDHALTIAKSDSPDPVQAGDLITYTITYAVPATDNEPAPNVIVEDYTPADTTFWSAAGASAIDDPGQGNPGLVRWHLGTLMPGDTASVQLVVRVDSPLPNNTFIFNSASISDDDGESAAVYDVGTRVESSHGLEITKIDDPDPVQAGGLINYTIAYSITGNQSAPNVTIRDTIPPDTTFESCSGGNYCFYNAGLGQVIWGLGRQNPGSGQVLLQVRANTPLPDDSSLINLVQISDDDGEFASDDEETHVSSDHALSISKSDDPDPVEAGAEIVYTLHWQATGNEPAPNIVIRDQVPDNTTFVGCSPAPCAESGGVVTWELGTVDAPAEGDVTLTVAVDNLLPDGTLLYNTPTIQDDEISIVTGDEIDTTVHSSHQLSVSKTDDPDPVEAGGQIDYTITYGVSGNQTSPNAVVVDTLPENTVYVAGSCAGAPCVHDNGVITWTLGTLAPPHEDTLSFSVSVASPLPNGSSLFNFVTISDDDGASAGDYEETLVSSDHALTIDKTDAPYDPVQAGDLITYTIGYGVPGGGNEPAPNVVIEDSIPEHTTFYTATGGLSIESPDVGGTGLVRWHLGDLNPGDAGQVTLVVRVDDPLPNNTAVENTATISDDDGESASAVETTTVHSAHSFVLEKYDTPDPVSPNQIINYTLHWAVTGNEAAQNIVITDTLPANTSFEGCSGCVLYGTYVRWNLSGDYPPGSEGDESLQVRVDTPLEDGSTIHNTSRIRDGSGGTPVETTIETTVHSDHALAVDKSAPSAVGAGQTMAYTIQYSVSGDEPAPAVIITDTVPANTAYMPGSCQPAGICSEIGGEITWALGDLEPGDTGAVSFEVTVNSPLPDGTEIWNTAFITDADDGYAEDSTLTTITSGHGFSLDKRDTGYDPVQAGEEIVYTLDWSVAGTEVAQDVVITDALPEHVTYVGCGPAPCGEAGGVVTWELGNLDPGASGTVEVTVAVESPLPNGTVLANQAEVTDSNGGLPASDSESTTVASSHALDVEKSGPATADAGGQIVYTIDWQVTGNETAEDLVIDDVTPVNTTFADATGATIIDDPGVGNSGLVRWHLGDQLPGASGTVTLVVDVDSPLPNGTEIANSATIADGNGGATDNDEASSQVESSHAFVLTKSDTPDPIAPDGIINYTIHWGVTGNEMAQNVVITDTLPANAALVNCGDCVVMGDWIYWERGNRNPGAGGDISLQVRVDSPLENGTVIHNVARITDDNGAMPAAAATETTVQSDHQLGLSKNASSVVEAGQYINYTVNWSVSGDEPAPAVIITDTVPANTAYVPGSCQPAGLCAEAGGEITWQLGQRLPGESGTVQFMVQVDDPLPDGTEIWNTAFITDADDGYAEDSTLTTITSGHGFSLDKRDTGYDPVQAGEEIVYTLEWLVEGHEVAQDVVITDALPEHVTYVDCGPAPCGEAGGVVTWELGELDPGASGTVEVTVQVESPLPNGTVLTNQADIADSNGGLPASDSESTTVASSHALDVEKSGPATADAGGQIVYTIDWQVTGNEAAVNLVIEDSTPEHTTFADATGATIIDAPDVGNSGLVRWHLGDQLPGASGTVTLVVDVGSPLPNGTTVRNQAGISDDNGGTVDNDVAQTTVVSGHGFTLSKSDNPDPVSPDGLINYTIHWEVTGNELAQSVVITDAIPANTTYESCGACVLMGDYVRWELGNRNPGDSGDVFLQVRVASILPDNTIITNEARIFDSNGGIPAEAQTTSTVQSGHVLVLEKSAPSTVNAGDQIVYTIAYEVTGDEVAPDAVISDTVPVNTTYVPGSCQPAGLCTEAGGEITWQLGTLSPGTEGIVQFTVDVNAPLDNGTAIDNTAHFADDDEGYAQDGATTVVVSAPDLTGSTKSVDLTDAAPGDLLIYTVTLHNDGNMVADAALSDLLPPHTAWVDWVAQNGAAYDPGTQTVSWAGQVAPATDVVIAYEVQIETPLDDGTEIENEAAIDDGVHPVFDIGPAQTTVHSAPDLTASFKEVDAANAAPGQELTYTLTLINNGDMVAHGAEVIDLIPAHSSYVPGSVTFDAGFAEYQPLYDRIRWTGDVEPDTDVVITFRVELDFPLDEGTEIVNWASVDDNFAAHEPFDTNTVTTVISAAPDMSGSTKAVDLTDASPGDQLRYTIALVNDGSMTAVAHLDDVLPADVTFASGPVVTGGGTGGYDAGARRIYWDGQVTPGSTVTIQYYVTVNNPLDDGAVILNAATIDDGYHAAFDTNQVQTTVHSAPDLTTSTKEVDQGSASPGDRIEYTITLNNLGNMNAAGVTVVDTLPPAYVTLVATPPGAVYDAGTGTLTWTGLAVNRNDPVVLTFQVDLDAVVPDGTLIVNHVEIDDGFNPESVERQATTIVGSAPNLTTSTKGVSAAEAAPADYLEYTLTIRNNGNAEAAGATLVDELPDHVVWDGWVTQNGAAYDPGSNSVTWTGDVAPGVDEVVVYRVQVEFPLDDDTVIENSATVDDNFAGHEVFDIGPVRTTVHSAPDLTASTKAVDLADAGPGDELTYTITLVNDGDMTAHDVVVLDEIPAHTGYVALSAAATDGTVAYQAAYDRIRWTGDVVPGQDVVITYRVAVDFPLDDGTEIHNFATVDDGVHSPFDTNTVVTTIHAEPNLSTSSKTVDLTDAVPGQVLHYTISLVNTGDMTAVTSIVDELPPDVTHAGGPTVHNGPPASWDPITRRITWSGEVAPGTDMTIEYYVTVNSPLDDGTIISNTATVDDGVHPAFELAPAAETTVHASPDLATSTKEVDRSVAPPGEVLEYTITLANSGNMNAAAVAMTDTLPVEVAFVSGPVVVGGGTASYDPAERQIVWNGPVVVDQPVTVRYTVRLDAGLAGGTLVQNTATIDDGRGNVIQIGPAETYVGHELGLTLTDGRDTVVPGQQITYTVAFSGTEPLNNGRVQIDLPAHTTFVGASSGYLNAGDAVFWLLSPQPPDFYGERHLVVQVDPVLDNGMVIETTASASGDGQSNSASEEALVVSSPDLSASVKQVSTDSAYPGDELHYTITLQNSGTMHAYQVTLTDTIPLNTSYVSGSISGGSYDSGSDTIRWEGPLNVGEVVTIEFSVTIVEAEDLTSFEPIRNVAVLDDGFAGHDALELEVETMLLGMARPDRYKLYLPIVGRNAGGPDLPDLVVESVVVQPASPTAGTPWDLEITIRNAGKAALPNGVWVDLYVDPLPERLPIEANEPFYDLCTFGGVWWIAELGADESVVLTKDDIPPDWLPWFPETWDTPGNHTLYVQVDSIDERTSPPPWWARVYELDETNNVFGPVIVPVQGVGGSTTESQPLPAEVPTRLPPQ